MSTTLCIQGGRCLDPETGTQWDGDLYVQNGMIVPPPPTPPSERRILDATGCWVTPGLLDVHVHLREPGGEASETIATGSAAARKGGFTGIVAMPNTTPPIDTPERVAYVLEQGRKAGHTRVMTTACLTRNRQGEEVADLAALAAAGAVAFTDDGCTVQRDDIMRQAMHRAAELGLPVMDHAQDRTMELRGGAMHEGERSREWHLPGIPAAAEIRIVERDLRLARETGCAIHIQHVSCAHSVELIRNARASGVRVTAEATPHHLMFCDDDIDPNRPDRFKMNPPLRTEQDRTALLEGVQDGTLNILATDHAPHPMQEKARGFVKAPFGVVGLETAVGVTYTLLVASGKLTMLDWLRAWTSHPARLLNIPPPRLSPGQPANLTLLDLDQEWQVDARQFASKGRNTPFDGLKLKGRATNVVLAKDS